MTCMMFARSCIAFATDAYIKNNQSFWCLEKYSIFSICIGTKNHNLIMPSMSTFGHLTPWHILS